MKKHFTLAIAAVAFCGLAKAQYAEESPFLMTNAPVNGERAMWDVQLDADPLLTAAGLAGVTWTGTEFWASRWANDSLFQLDGTGTKTGFSLISGVTGVRAMTYVAPHIYMTNNTTAILKVDPVSKTLVSTAFASISGNARYLTYDPTLDSGNGGFWVGDYGSDWTAVNMSGNVLSTILATTHGMTGVYSLAYDPYSSGGPYLWAYSQGGGSGTAQILYQFDMSGNATGVSHDTKSDLAGGIAAGGLAGGSFTTNTFQSGTASLGGLLQGVSLFMYELAAVSSIQDEAQIEEKFQVFPNPAAQRVNIGIMLPSNMEVKMDVYNNAGALVRSQSAQTLGAGGHNLGFDVSAMENGYYNVVLTVNGATYHRNLTIIH